MMFNKVLNWIFRVDWVVDDDGDLVCRLWGWFGIGHYKWQDGAIFQNARGYRPIAKRGVEATPEEEQDNA